MGSEPIFNIENLLQPFEGDSPAGMDLRENRTLGSAYDRLRDARREAASVERKLRQSSPGDEIDDYPDWDPVIELGPQILMEESKDLEVASFLLEGWLRVYGFAGLRDGFKLLTGLVENFADTVYPLPDDEGEYTRTAPLTALNGEEGEGTLQTPMMLVPITEQGSEGGPYSLIDYKQALEVQKIEDSERREKRIQQGAVTMENFNDALRGTSESFLRQTLEDLAEAHEAFLVYERITTDKFREAPPPTSALQKTFEELLHNYRSLTSNRITARDDDGPGTDGAADGVSSVSEDGSVVVATGRPGVAVGDLVTREDAIRALRKLAQYFLKTEPHSPLSYSLQQAIRWADIPLPQLLQELIPDESARQHIFMRIGISEDGSE